MRNISGRIISRALLYIRTLEHLIKEKRFLVSSGELERLTGISDVKIRKDISKFGKVGTPRIGYSTVDLKNTLEDFVLQKRTIRIAVFGTGNLGTAILKYPGFRRGKLSIVAAFDKAAKKIGRKVNGVRVYPVEKAPSVIKKLKVDLGIIAVPPESSQEVADLMVLSGLKGIVNFAPVSISTPKKVLVKDMDFSLEFLSLYCETRA
jgi:redox-sensing transcriptional repressor